MITRYKDLLFIGVSLSIVFILLAPFFLSDNPNTIKKPQTIREIKWCYSLIARLESDSHESIKDILKKEKTTGSLNKDISLLLKKNKEVLNRDDDKRWDKNIRYDEIIDAWGHPLRFEWRENLVEKHYGYMKTNINAELVIWSIGNNGIDEFGLGDDVSIIER